MLTMVLGTPRVRPGVALMIGAVEKDQPLVRRVVPMLVAEEFAVVQASPRMDLSSKKNIAMRGDIPLQLILFSQNVACPSS